MLTQSCQVGAAVRKPVPRAPRPGTCAPCCLPDGPQPAACRPACSTRPRCVPGTSAALAPPAGCNAGHWPHGWHRSRVPALCLVSRRAASPACLPCNRRCSRTPLHPSLMACRHPHHLQPGRRRHVRVQPALGQCRCGSPTAGCCTAPWRALASSTRRPCPPLQYAVSAAVAGVCRPRTLAALMAWSRPRPPRR